MFTCSNCCILIYFDYIIRLSGYAQIFCFSIISFFLQERYVDNSLWFSTPYQYIMQSFYRCILLICRSDLLCFAVTHCTPEMIEPILRAKCVLDTQVSFFVVYININRGKINERPRNPLDGSIIAYIPIP